MEALRGCRYCRRVVEVMQTSKRICPHEVHHCQHIWALVIRCVHRIEASELAPPTVTSHLGTLSWGPTHTFAMEISSFNLGVLQGSVLGPLLFHLHGLSADWIICTHGLTSMLMIPRCLGQLSGRQKKYKKTWMSTRILITWCLDYRSRILPEALGFPNIWRQSSQCPRPKPLESSTCRHLHVLHLRHT